MYIYISFGYDLYSLDQPANIGFVIVQSIAFEVQTIQQETAPESDPLPLLTVDKAIRRKEIRTHIQLSNTSGLGRPSANNQARERKPCFLTIRVSCVNGNK
jgi:hypothetical protein